MDANCAQQEKPDFNSGTFESASLLNTFLTLSFSLMIYSGFFAILLTKFVLLDFFFSFFVEDSLGDIKEPGDRAGSNDPTKVLFSTLSISKERL